MSAPESIKAYAARVAAEAPPLTPDAAALIVAVFRPLVRKNAGARNTARLSSVRRSRSAA